MSRSRIVFILVVIALTLAYCGDKPTYQFNAKFSVTVDMHGVEKTASSVVSYREVFAHPTFDLTHALGGSGVSTEFKGEAIVLELERNRFLFVLLPEKFVSESSDVLNYPDFGRLYPDNSVYVKKIQEKIDAVKATGAVQEVPREIYPYFVIFNNIKNPDRLNKVDPRNFSYAIGPGYSLKSLTMTYTEEPVTTGKVIAAVGEGFFEKWDAKLLSRLDAEWARYRDDFGQMPYRDTFIIGEDKNGR